MKMIITTKAGETITPSYIYTFEYGGKHVCTLIDHFTPSLIYSLRQMPVIAPMEMIEDENGVMIEKVTYLRQEDVESIVTEEAGDE